MAQRRLGSERLLHVNPLDLSWAKAVRIGYEYFSGTSSSSMHCPNHHHRQLSRAVPAKRAFRLKAATKAKSRPTLPGQSGSAGNPVLLGERG